MKITTMVTTNIPNLSHCLLLGQQLVCDNLANLVISCHHHEPFLIPSRPSHHS
jgi:hypothetical protein